MRFELSDLEKQVHEVLEQTQLMGQNLSPEQFNWRKNPYRWSFGQCIDHLNVTNQVFLRTLQEAVAQAKHPANGPARYPFWEGWVIWFEEPPPKIKLPAPKVIQPATEHQPQATLQRFYDQHQQLLGLAQQARSLDWGRNKSAIYLFPRVKFSLGTVFAMALGHDRRHLFQAGQVLAEANFPSE